MALLTWPPPPVAAPKDDSPRSDASASEPRPMAHWPKRWRRVMVRSSKGILILTTGKVRGFGPRCGYAPSPQYTRAAGRRERRRAYGRLKPRVRGGEPGRRRGWPPADRPRQGRQGRCRLGGGRRRRPGNRPSGCADAELNRGGECPWPRKVSVSHPAPSTDSRQAAIKPCGSNGNGRPAPVSPGTAAGEICHDRRPAIRYIS